MFCALLGPVIRWAFTGPLAILHISSTNVQKRRVYKHRKIKVKSLDTSNDAASFFVGKRYRPFSVYKSRRFAKFLAYYWW